MRPVDSRIEPLLAQLATDRKLPTGAEDSIRQAISESPLLTGLLARSAAEGQIGRIAVSYDKNNAGHFEAGKNGQPGTIHISASNFDWQGERRINLLTEVIGHETMHGVLAKQRELALE